MIRKIVIAGILALAPALALAAAPVATGIGPRVGFSSSPDQLVLGGQLTFGEIAPSLSFDPSAEVGVGDNLTTVAINFDMHYHFETRTTWRPYVGGGASLSFVSFDQDHFGNRDSETDGGGSLVIGAGAPTRAGDRFFSELKLGLGDVPDFKLMVGWNFSR